MMKNISSFFSFAAFCVISFPPQWIGSTFQLALSLFLFGLSILTLIISRSKFQSFPSSYSLCTIIILIMGQLAASPFSSDPLDSISFSLLSLLKLSVVVMLVSLITLEKYLLIFSVSFAACFFIIYFPSHVSQIFQSLTNPLLRSAPFSFHFNLYGVTYGLVFCVIVSLFLFTSSSKSFHFAKAISNFLLIFLLLAMFAAIVATGSRSSILGVILFLLLYLAYYARLLSLNYKILFCAILVLSSMLIIISGALQDIISIASDILSLDSEYRGINSGATGRTEIWSNNLEKIDILGFGYSPESIGIVDNSFIYLIVSSGVLFSAPFLFSLIFKFIRLGSLYFSSRCPSGVFFIFPLMAYCVFNGIFNQQLLGLTSPISFVFVAIYIYSSSYSAISLKNIPFEFRAPRKLGDSARVQRY